MRSPLCFLLVVLIAPAALGGQETPGQAPQHFYNVDKEVRIEGTVREIRFEPRYKDRSTFLIVVLQAARSGETFNVEVSPSSFFSQDLHQGERLTIVGSLAGEGAVIARQMRFRGETVILRDKKGFPSWIRRPVSPKAKRGIGGL